MFYHYFLNIDKSHNSFSEFKDIEINRMQNEINCKYSDSIFQTVQILNIYMHVSIVQLLNIK